MKLLHNVTCYRINRRLRSRFSEKRRKRARKQCHTVEITIHRHFIYIYKSIEITMDIDPSFVSGIESFSTLWAGKELSGAAKNLVLPDSLRSKFYLPVCIIDALPSNFISEYVITYIPPLGRTRSAVFEGSRRRPRGTDCAWNSSVDGTPCCSTGTMKPDSRRRSCLQRPTAVGPDWRSKGGRGCIAFNDCLVLTMLNCCLIYQ